MGNRETAQGARDVVKDALRIPPAPPPSYHQIDSTWCKSQHIWRFLGTSVSPYPSAGKHRQSGQEMFLQVFLLTLPSTNYPTCLFARLHKHVGPVWSKKTCSYLSHSPKPVKCTIRADGSNTWTLMSTIRKIKIYLKTTFSLEPQLQ